MPRKSERLSLQEDEMYDMYVLLRFETLPREKADALEIAVGSMSRSLRHFVELGNLTTDFKKNPRTTLLNLRLQTTYKREDSGEHEPVAGEMLDEFCSVLDIFPRATPAKQHVAELLSEITSIKSSAQDIMLGVNQSAATLAQRIIQTTERIQRLLADKG